MVYTIFFIDITMQEQTGSKRGGRRRQQPLVSATDSEV